MPFSLDILTYFIIMLAISHPLEQAIHLQHARRQGDHHTPMQIILHGGLSLLILTLITWCAPSLMSTEFDPVILITTIIVVGTQGYHLLTRSRLASTQPSMQGWINQHIRPFSLLRPEILVMALLLANQAPLLADKITLLYLYISLTLANSSFLLFVGKAQSYISTNDACIVGRFLGIILVMFTVFLALVAYRII